MPSTSQHAVVIGGGIMGGDIATLFAAHGWAVHVLSPSAKTRDALPARISGGLAKLGAPAGHAASVKCYAELKAIPWADVAIVVEAATEVVAAAGSAALTGVGPGVAFLLLRSGAFADESRRKHRAIAGIVGAAFAFALAAVWPISGWILPFLRSAMDDDG